MEKTYCLNCGKESHYGSGKFCSKRCQIKFAFEHRKKKGGKCEFCGKEIKEKASLTRHLKKCHLNPKRDKYWPI
jgi:endogenous inhibitor of DNA gyrase (YacG/DUF329 family)